MVEVLQGYLLSMAPTFESLQELAGELPGLDFSLNTDQLDWLSIAPVQDYLNHYHINFTQERLCRRHHFGSFRAAGFDIAAHIWQADLPKGTVFLLHGFTDSVGLMQHAVRFLLEQQWTVVAFDLPGHGLSSGEQASIDSFDQYREVLEVCLQHSRGALPKPWYGMGQSTGASVWLNYLGHHPEQTEIDKLLLLAPLIRPRGWGLARWVFPGLKLLGKDVVRKYNLTSHDQEFLDFVREGDPLQARITPLRWAVAMEEWIDNFRSFSVQQRPLTIIQGDDDQTVDAEYNLEAIREVFPNTTVKMIRGGRHQLVNESLEYRERVFKRVGEWLAS